jgi:hypothetical protein
MLYFCRKRKRARRAVTRKNLKMRKRFSAPPPLQRILEMTQISLVEFNGI